MMADETSDVVEQVLMLRSSTTTTTSSSGSGAMLTSESTTTTTSKARVQRARPKAKVKADARAGRNGSAMPNHSPRQTRLSFKPGELAVIKSTKTQSAKGSSSASGTQADPM